jgi:HSP20 family protein
MLWTDLERFWDPWDDFEKMRRAIWAGDGGRTSEFPLVNTWVAADDSVVTTEIPGVDPEKIDISVSGKTVTLRGARKADDIAEGRTYHRRERWSGEFTKSVELPFAIEAEKVKAIFRKGVLSLTLPKAEAEKPRKIEIKSG